MSNNTIQKKGVQAQPARRIFLINPGFQVAFLAYTVGIAVVAIALFQAADAYFFWKWRQLGQGMHLPPGHVFFQFLEEQKSAKTLYSVIAGLGAVLLLSLWGLLLSHRVAGPLYRLREHMCAAARGETISDVRFRDGDFFLDVAEAYNLQMVRYRGALSGGRSRAGAGSGSPDSIEGLPCGYGSGDSSDSDDSSDSNDPMAA